MTGIGGFAGVFRYGGMTTAQAERSMRLFAREVLPELRKLPAFAPPVAEATASA
jgi:hypothetical protein